MNTEKKFVLKIECVCYPGPPIPGEQDVTPHGNEHFYRTSELKSVSSPPLFDSFLLQGWDFFFPDEERGTEK